jgi:flagellar motor protein MotB
MASGEERAALVSSIARPLEAAVALGDEPVDMGASPFALSEDRASQCIGCLLRLAVEKQDRVRAAAGRALTRMLHDAALPALSVPAPSAVRLRESVMPAVNAADESAPVTLPQIVEAFERAQTARASRMRDDTRAAEEDADAEGDAATDVDADAPAEGVPATGHARGGVNYAAPDEVFPRLVALLTVRHDRYASELAEGFSLSVGGMSESVVKSSASALTAWTKAAGAPKGDRLGLEALMSNLLVMLRGRAPKSSHAASASAAAASSSSSSSSSGGAHDDEAERAKSMAEQAGGYRVESRMVVPVLRTLHSVLSKGQLAESNARRSQWARETVPLLRYRVMRSSDPVRVMTAGEVLLGVLPLPQPVGAAALRTVLDLVAHPFPKVRRVTAERLFSALMVFDDLFHEEVAPPTADAADAKPAASAAESERAEVAPWLEALREMSDEGPEVVGFWGCDADTAIAILSSVAWDGETEAVVAARDTLYEPLGLVPPTRRMGALREDGAGRWGYPDDSALVAGSGDALESYMALVQEVGY